MTPFLRLSLSLTLTLAVWGPNAVDEVASGTMQLAHLLLRFVITFAFFRVSVWGVSALLDSYRSSSAADRPVVMSPTSVERRRASDGDANAPSGSSTPSFPAGSRNSLGT